MATLRVSDRTRETLRELTGDGETMRDVAEKAIEAYRRRLVLERTNAAYAELRSSPEAWAEELEERAHWDAALAPGLEGEHSCRTP